MDNRRAVTVLLLGLLAWVSPALAAGGAPPVSGASERRATGFLEILDDPPEQQRRFVQENFTAEAISRRGLDGLVKFLEQVHKDLGDARYDDIEVNPDKVLFLLPGPEGEPLLFTVLFSPAPESKIRGFLLGPPDEAAPPPPSVAESELPKAIADIVAQARTKGFVGQVLVARRGEVLFGQAYGEADRASYRAITLDTPINLASNNKMFTALLIGQLVEEGKLAWDDKVGKFLPDWPNAEVRQKVTVAHLLSHTSGLGEYWGPAHAAKAPTLDTVAEYAELFREDKPAATPGTEFKYSNNGYVLLGLIAEKATGRDYYELVRERIYARAGMQHAEHYLKSDATAGFAIGYQADGTDNIGRLALRGSPAGGGYASARDLLLFANALLDGKLVKPQTFALMTTGHAPMGPEMAYGYGFGVTAKPEKHFGHDGGTPGTNSSFEVFPDSGYIVIVQSNTGQGSQPLSRRLIALIEARKRAK
jgi:CubicO group peptidase (beta-lactamase class C family)